MSRTLVLLALLLSISLQARAADIDLQVRQAVEHANATYQAAGLSGLVAESQRCYKARPLDLYCVNFDVAASYLDRRLDSAMHIKRYPYFDSAQFLKRARPVFAHARWNIETTNLYLQFVDSAAQSVIIETMSAR